MASEPGVRALLAFAADAGSPGPCRPCSSCAVEEPSPSRLTGVDHDEPQDHGRARSAERRLRGAVEAAHGKLRSEVRRPRRRVSRWRSALIRFAPFFEVSRATASSGYSDSAQRLFDELAAVFPGDVWSVVPISAPSRSPPDVGLRWQSRSR